MFTYSTIQHNILPFSFQILVRTMHKYVALIEVSEMAADTVTQTITFSFMETTFIVVTSYLSSQVRLSCHFFLF